MEKPDILAAIHRINAALPLLSRAAIAQADPASLCKTYGAIEGDIKLVLPAIALIPDVGIAVVAVVGILTAIADAVCPIVTQQGAKTA